MKYACGGMRIEPPGAPLLEAVHSLLRPAGLVGVRLARDLEELVREIRARSERRQLELGGSGSGAAATSSSEMT